MIESIFVGALAGVAIAMLLAIPITNWQYRRFYRQQFGREPPEDF
jgi:hypothetical protein